jgi:hypothetical protein
MSGHFFLRYPPFTYPQCKGYDRVYVRTVDEAGHVEYELFKRQSEGGWAACPTHTIYNNQSHDRQETEAWAIKNMFDYCNARAGEYAALFDVPTCTMIPHCDWIEFSTSNLTKVTK